MNAYDLAECQAVLLRRPRWADYSCAMKRDPSQNDLAIFLLAPDGEAIGDVWDSQWKRQKYLNWHGVAYLGLFAGEALDNSDQVFHADTAGATMTLLLNYLETRA